MAGRVDSAARAVPMVGDRHLPRPDAAGIVEAMMSNAEHRVACRRECVGPGDSGKAHLACAVLCSLEPICKRHAGQHHRFFGDRHTGPNGWQDCRGELFPALPIVFCFGAFAPLLEMQLARRTTLNFAWPFGTRR